MIFDHICKPHPMQVYGIKPEWRQSFEREKKKALFIINMGTSLMQNTIVIPLLSNEQICNTKNNCM